VAGEPEISSDLRDLSFASAVGELVRADATGVLRVYDAIGTNRAFFREGKPQGARLSRLKNPIGRILVEEGTVSEADLDRALDVHNKTEKLLGQILIELEILDEDGLNRVMHKQSRLNFLTLFGNRDGRMEFDSGLVHLTDFTPAPMSPLMTLYEGTRDYARDEVTFPLLAQLAFAAVALSESAHPLLAELPPAEQMAARLLSAYRFTGDLARSVPLAPKALAALLFALDELGGLTIGPAVSVPRA
jgi:hypothetical protein